MRLVTFMHLLRSALHLPKRIPVRGADLACRQSKHKYCRRQLPISVAQLRASDCRHVLPHERVISVPCQILVAITHAILNHDLCNTLHLSKSGFQKHVLKSLELRCTLHACEYSTLVLYRTCCTVDSIGINRVRDRSEIIILRLTSIFLNYETCKLLG